jgi:hypothetical protein
MDQTVTWPPRSPDLIALDFFFFLWGYVKNTVYQVKINDLQHLKAPIRDAVATVTPNMLQTMWNEVDIVWIFVVQPKEPTPNFIEKVIYSVNFIYRFPL